MTDKAPARKPVKLKVKNQPKQPISNSDAAKRLYGKPDDAKAVAKK